MPSLITNVHVIPYVAEYYAFLARVCLHAGSYPVRFCTLLVRQNGHASPTDISMARLAGRLYLQRNDGMYHRCETLFCA
jgi:hypothetical protein